MMLCRLGLLLLKRQEQPFLHFLAHSLAGIRHHKFIEELFLLHWQFADRHADTPALWRKLIGVGNQIQQYLIEAQHIALDLLHLYLVHLHGKGNLFLLTLRSIYC